MRAAVHIVPAAGVQLDSKADGRRRGSGIATAALQMVEQLDGPVDLVLLAVPAGRAERFVAQLAGSGHAC